MSGLARAVWDWRLSCGIVNHPALRGLSFYLETPNELDGYAREIALLRSE